MPASCPKAKPISCHVISFECPNEMYALHVLKDSHNENKEVVFTI